MTALQGDVSGLGHSTSGLLAFSDDESLLEKIARAVPGTREGIDLHMGGLDAAIGAVAGGATAEVLLIDVVGQPQLTDRLTTLMQSVAGRSAVLLVGAENDITLYRQVIMLGVTDYLLASDLSVKQIRRAVLTASRSEPETVVAENAPTARVTVIIGVRGGIGTTSVTTGLAWQIANQQDRQVGLIDLDLQFGTAALSLDLDPGSGLREALENSDRIDSLFVASAMVQSGRNLNILSAEESPARHVSISPESISRLLEAVKPDLDHILLEVPRHLIGAAVPVMETAEDVLLVTDLSLAGLRDTGRIRNSLTDVLGDGKVHLVACRVGLNSDARLSIGEFEKILQTKFTVVIEEDPKAGKAALEGKPIGSGPAKPKTGEAVAKLARLVAGVAEDTGKKGLLDRLKGLRHA